MSGVEENLEIAIKEKVAIYLHIAQAGIPIIESVYKSAEVQSRFRYNNEARFNLLVRSLTREIQTEIKKHCPFPLLNNEVEG